MHIIRKALVFLTPIIISGCLFGTIQTESVSRDKNPELNKAAGLSALKNTKPRPAIDVERDLKTALAQPQIHTDLWSVIRDELQFKRNLNQPGVSNKIAWFARHQDYLHRVSDRAQPYLYHIIIRLKERKMPLDLALLPIVESAYQPFAYSPSHASGIWQFIPATGKRYGLKQNWWYDGRRDIVAATDAALDYLAMLHKRFHGNWFHALAAYNAGEGNVERAIRRNKKAGKKIDFWSLRLPRETRSYVPSLLAVAEILKNNKQYKINFKAIPDKPYFEIIDVGSQIDLATIAELSGLPIDEVYRLNPGFNRWATDPEGPHHILLPVDKTDAFKQKLSALPVAERISWKQHKIRQGESLSQIADRYQTSITVLKQTNRLKGNLIRTGHALLIPIAKKSNKYYSLSADSRRFKDLKKTNDGKRYLYTVKRGDNLWDIGRHYGISVRQLTQWNGLSSKGLLYPGQKLAVWVREDTTQKQKNISKVVAGNTPGDSYTVKRGDSLWLIAKKFDVHIEDLLKWNKIKKNRHLQPGQNLIIKQNRVGV